MPIVKLNNYFCLLGCNTVQSAMYLPGFWRHLLTSSLKLQNRPNRAKGDTYRERERDRRVITLRETQWETAGLNVQPCKWRLQIIPKRPQVANSLSAITFQKTIIIITVCESQISQLGGIFVTQFFLYFQMWNKPSYFVMQTLSVCGITPDFG